MSWQYPQKLPDDAVKFISDFASDLNDAIESSSIPEKFSGIGLVSILQHNVKALQDHIKGKKGTEALSEDERNTLREFTAVILEQILAACDSLKMDFKEHESTKYAYTLGLRTILKPRLDNFLNRWPHASRALSKIKQAKGLSDKSKLESKGGVDDRSKA